MYRALHKSSNSAPSTGHAVSSRATVKKEAVVVLHIMTKLFVLDSINLKNISYCKNDNWYTKH